MDYNVNLFWFAFCQGGEEPISQFCGRGIFCSPPRVPFMINFVLRLISQEALVGHLFSNYSLLDRAVSRRFPIRSIGLVIFWGQV